MEPFVQTISSPQEHERKTNGYKRPEPHRQYELGRVLVDNDGEINAAPIAQCLPKRRTHVAPPVLVVSRGNGDNDENGRCYAGDEIEDQQGQIPHRASSIFKLALLHRPGTAKLRYRYSGRGGGGL